MLLIVLVAVALAWLGVLSIVVAICVIAGRADRVLVASARSRSRAHVARTRDAAPSRLSGPPRRRFARSCP